MEQLPKSEVFFIFFIIVEPHVMLFVHPLLVFNLPQSSSTAGECPCEWTRENSLNLFFSVRMSSVHGWSRVLPSACLSHYTGETAPARVRLSQGYSPEAVEKISKSFKMSGKGVTEEENI